MEFAKLQVNVEESYVSSFLNRIVRERKFSQINVDELTKTIVKSLPPTVNNDEFYNYLADQCVLKTSTDTEYNKLASHILTERLHKITHDDIGTVATILYMNNDIKGRHSPLISEKQYNTIMKHKDKIQSVIDMNRDYDFDYFATRTLQRSYLMRIKAKKSDIIVERPQHMIMRVAIGIHGHNLKDAYQTYDLMSRKYFTHATPTLFNAGTNRPQLSSCFLTTCEDSIEEIFKSVSSIAYISKWAGGIGVHLTAVRPKGSIIRGTNGRSDGIIPLCQVLNQVSRYINQGGKRSGSFACYLEPWHADIFDFCELRKNTGAEELRARDLFLSLWIPDIFMRRVENDEMWTLMCPDESKNLNTTHGSEFEKLYLEYESTGKFIRQVKARKLWQHIMECQIETGFPYMLYKDHANNKSNQQNLGTIRSSNLCVSSDTLILTDKGNVRIDSVVNEHVNIWNGETWSRVTVRMTGADVSLMQIKFSNGSRLDCTREHKFYVNGQSAHTPAMRLKVGDVLNTYKLPTSDGNFINCNDVRVISVEEDVKIDNTYCFREPLKHMGVFNGLLTGQCAEIIEYSDTNETAVCNLASVCLPRFIETVDDKKIFNHEKLVEITRVVVRNLNKVIDRNYYPTKETKYSNMKHRPVGIGIQGLADVYNIMGYPWDSPEARLLNKQIFETLYYASVDESKELAKVHTHYVSFGGSPFSKGQLQFDLWGLNKDDLTMNYDWDTLKKEVTKFGTYNSLLTALMPTASTAQIMGCSECFEPYMSNIFVRGTLAGEFIVVNEHLQRDLKQLGLWSEDMKKKLIINNGSIQNIVEIPDKIKQVYKKAFELPLKSIIQQSIERGPFIDQSQSLNLFMEQPNFTLLTSAHFYGWKGGLKTGMYYLRGSSAVNPINFGVDIEDIKRLTGKNTIADLLSMSSNDKQEKIEKIDTDKKVEINKLDEIKETTESDSDDEPVMCKFDASKKAEGCLMCSS